MSDTQTALAVIPASAVSTIVSADKNDILGKLAAKVSGFKADVSTPTGRREIASLALQVASSKMDLIRLGKSLTEEWRASTSKVNAECKVIEEKMNALKDQVRAPLTAFEDAEKARVAGHEEALARISNLHPDLERTTSAEIAKAIAWRLEPEARNWQEFHQRAIDAHAATIQTLRRWKDTAEIREEEAAELAKLKAEEAERQRLATEEAQKRREAEIAERARIEAERRAAEAAVAEAKRVEQQRLAAEQEAERRVAKAQADAEAAREKAERDRMEAVEAERRRAAKEAADAKTEADRREANVAHKRKINNDVLAAIVLAIAENHSGNAAEASNIAKAIVTAIAAGKVPHTKISY